MRFHRSDTMGTGRTWVVRSALSEKSEATSFVIPDAASFESGNGKKIFDVIIGFFAVVAA